VRYKGRCLRRDEKKKRKERGSFHAPIVQQNCHLEGRRRLLVGSKTFKDFLKRLYLLVPMFDAPEIVVRDV